MMVPLVVKDDNVWKTRRESKWNIHNCPPVFHQHVNECHVENKQCIMNIFSFFQTWNLHKPWLRDDHANRISSLLADRLCGNKLWLLKSEISLLISSCSTKTGNRRKWMLYNTLYLTFWVIWINSTVLQSGTLYATLLHTTVFPFMYSGVYFSWSQRRCISIAPFRLKGIQSASQAQRNTLKGNSLYVMWAWMEVRTRFNIKEKCHVAVKDVRLFYEYLKGTVHPETQTKTSPPPDDKVRWSVVVHRTSLELHSKTELQRSAKQLLNPLQTGCTSTLSTKQLQWRAHLKKGVINVFSKQHEASGELDDTRRAQWNHMLLQLRRCVSMKLQKTKLHLTFHQHVFHFWTAYL